MVNEERRRRRSLCFNREGWYVGGDMIFGTITALEIGETERKEEDRGTK